MSISSQQYAYLADDSYQDRPVGIRKPGEEERVAFEGVRYKILEHVNNRSSGYQGTIYQREDTGEVVVAHRGTEFRKLRSDPLEVFSDLARADGGMVLTKTNLQAADALGLTQRAMEYAARFGAIPGNPSHAVTVTGHSLGATLAQITGHRFGLRGETFNAYGAGSLSGHGVPAGPNDQMVNHVKATDFVSAASPQYGQVRIYATPQDILKLKLDGYLENPLADRLLPDRPATVAASSVGDHMMRNFLDRDPRGLTLLTDPDAVRLAADNARAIGDYRGDVAGIRSGITNSVGLPFQGIQRGLERLEESIQQSLRERYLPQPVGVPQVLPQQVPPGFPMRGFRSGVLDGQDDAPRSLQSDPAAYVDRMLAASRAGDDGAFRQLTAAAAQGPAGQAMREQAIATVDMFEQAQRHAEQQRALEPQPASPVHAMRMA